MTKLWTTLAIFAAFFLCPAAAVNKFLAESSGELQVSGPKHDKTKKSEKHKKTVLKLPRVSAEIQGCFSKLVFGISPGSSLGPTTEASVDECMARCAGLEECNAMSFRMSDGLCQAINRSNYEGKFEKSDEKVVANKLAGCKAVLEGKMPVKTPKEGSEDVQLSEPKHSKKSKKHKKHVIELPAVSAEAKGCFSTLVFGVSPGSSLGPSKEASADECMSRCAALDGCYAMSFRMSDGLCQALNRTYEGKFEESDERVVANKLHGCKEVPSKKSRYMALPKTSAETQACFTSLVFGVSPGSSLGPTTEASADACMSRCAGLKDCEAMTFRMSDGLCQALNRTYEGKFEESEERVVANRIQGCKASPVKSGILHKIGAIVTWPFRAIRR